MDATRSLARVTGKEYVLYMLTIDKEQLRPNLGILLGFVGVLKRDEEEWTAAFEQEQERTEGRPMIYENAEDFRHKILNTVAGWVYIPVEYQEGIDNIFRQEAIEKHPTPVGPAIAALIDENIRLGRKRARGIFPEPPSRESALQIAYMLRGLAREVDSNFVEQLENANRVSAGKRPIKQIPDAHAE